MDPHDRVRSGRSRDALPPLRWRTHVTGRQRSPGRPLKMVMSLRLCLRRPNAGCMTWFSPCGENYAHTGAFTGSMNRV
jgi:hypothetical protein